MSENKLLYEGKAKQLFKTDKDNQLIQFFKDDATAFNKKKHEIINSKGVLNNLISENIFKYLGENGIPNHFIERLNEREQLIKKVEIIPIEVVVRNKAAGTFTKRFGIEEGMDLPETLIEFNLKDDEHDDPLISDEHIKVFKWANQSEIDDIKHKAILINKYLTDLFNQIDILLVDFKIEFGRFYSNGKTEIILADEISPDSCRLWDIKSNEKLDKDRFRRNLGGLIEAYKEVATRLQIDLSNF
ncbi:MAG: phosphoribosylaminoimidazolesuccinocarboxamide synthase [Alphaproteobacteria bacterium]|nr:phosphoribosylaminoimidazolesuccinocarboxamide synthase [Rhodobiaceae bacterium]MDC0070778.1 phosphoribosylaminoimidazolesuccinocarboxamide synthase [Rhodobiaceae bacterium]PDH51782.1 MAG: phosphoribosylaminoimidazolesuccinocarboxamide synthase [alpha proteobacterium MED-G09]|tara:strand:- start:252 stop:983 length:732 start_codon:yes stop_codon:yes gene_type:complete